MEIRPRRAETHPILAGVMMMDEAILLPSYGAARAARRRRRAAAEAFSQPASDAMLRSRRL